MRAQLPDFARRHLIGGQLRDGDGDELAVEDPSTATELATLTQASTAQVSAAVESADRAFGPWSERSAESRARALHAFADALEAHREEFVATIVAEAGTPISLARSLQVDTPLAHLRWYAEAARRDWTQDLGVSEAAPRSAGVIAHRPVGVVAALTAYNYPLLLAVSKMGAALAAGCTVVLMPSPLAPLATLLIGRAALEADLPPGVLNVLCGGQEQAVALTLAPGVAKISFTGSLGVGTAVMRQAAEGMKDVILELGGKSPNLLLPGVDLAAITEAVHLRYLRNAGQGCASPTRLLVHRNQYDEFAERSRKVFEAVPVGDPWDPATVVGPVITAAHRARIDDVVSSALADGAELIARGARPDGAGHWVAPALVGGMSPGAPIAQEEIFGPVGVVLPYDTVDEAVELANGVQYGLAANVYADDVDAARSLAGRLRAGLVTINGGGALRPDGVFGGFKASGIGREHGEWGIREFLEPQHVQWPV
jgi:aldehyde dehydrogenase (NAD+)